MGKKRLSEQFVWTDAKVRRMNGYLAAGQTRAQAAKLLGCGPKTLNEKLDELGLAQEHKRQRWGDRLIPSRAVQP